MNRVLGAPVKAGLAVFAFVRKGRLLVAHGNRGYGAYFPADAAAVTRIAYFVHFMEYLYAQ